MHRPLGGSDNETQGLRRMSASGPQTRPSPSASGPLPMVGGRKAANPRSDVPQISRTLGVHRATATEGTLPHETPSPPPHWRRPRQVSVVVDNDSWILPHAERLVAWCKQAGDRAALVRTYDAVPEGVVAFFLGCVRIAPAEVLVRNAFNLVVHESALPQGRGFAPVAWQILAGENVIPVCLIEAAATADEGRIYGRTELRFEGHELNPEIRAAQGEASVRLCQEFLDAPVPPTAAEQTGQPSSYPRRRPADSELDINKTIAEQFPRLRIVDNERYPAFFKLGGHTYRLTITKQHGD